MSGPTTRVLAILELLQSHRFMRGADLAKRLGVDRRTVRRYISVLEDMGVPVTTELGRYGGYMLVPGFKLPPMMFTDEETIAISLGLLAARQLGLARAAPAIDSVQAKLERVMPNNLKKRVRGVRETTQLLLPRATPFLDDRVLLTVMKAVQAEQRLRFTYCSAEKVATQRDADLYGLVFHRGHWYMSGFCHLRQALRSFRLDRITNAQILHHNFQRPAGFDAAEFFTKSLCTLPRPHKVSVLLYADAETAAKALGFHSGAAEMLHPHPQGVLLSTDTDSVEWLASLAGGFVISVQCAGTARIEGSGAPAGDEIDRCVRIVRGPIIGHPRVTLCLQVSTGRGPRGNDSEVGAKASLRNFESCHHQVKLLSEFREFATGLCDLSSAGRGFLRSVVDTYQ